MLTMAPSCVWLKLGAVAQGPSTKQSVHFVVAPAYDQQRGVVASIADTDAVGAAVATLNVASG